MKLWVIVSVIALLLLPVVASADAPVEMGQGENPPVIVKILDLLIVRPVSAGVATITTAFTIVTCPVAAMFGVGEAEARVLVEAPWRFTGMRPLGDFSGRYKDNRPITVVEDR